MLPLKKWRPKESGSHLVTEQAGASSTLISRTRTRKQPYCKNYFKLHSISQAGRVSLIHNAKKKVFHHQKSSRKWNSRAGFLFLFFNKSTKSKGQCLWLEGLSSHSKLKHRGGDRISVGSRRKEKFFFLLAVSFISKGSQSWVSSLSLCSRGKMCCCEIFKRPRELPVAGFLIAFLPSAKWRLPSYSFWWPQALWSGLPKFLSSIRIGVDTEGVKGWKGSGCTEDTHGQDLMRL